ncbi:hypothetical protein ABZ863_17585 [Saccharomonospora sp. NPDC046836]|uniref:hypothetical protein n=1 Tax=Saccharomonospora sp. NPDC046836 TaxID=3156921 RepID=UPI0033E52A4D
MYGSKGSGPTITAGGALATTGPNTVFLVMGALALLVMGALLLRSAYLAKQD